MAAITTDRLSTAEGTAHVLRAGSGDPAAPLCVVLHGGGPGSRAATSWEPTLAALGEDRPVVAPDLVGFGESEQPSPRPDGPIAWFDLRVRQVLAIADVLGHDRLDLVGNSLGGVLAMRIALAHPDRVGRIALVGSAGSTVPPTPGLLGMLRAGLDPTPEALEALLRSYVHDESRLGDVDAAVASRLPLLLDPTLRAAWHAMYHDAAGELAAGEVALAPEQLATIEHEALVLHGIDDEIIDVEAARWIHGHLPNADLHLLHHTGHLAQLDSPLRVSGLIGAFLRESRG